MKRFLLFSVLAFSFILASAQPFQRGQLLNFLRLDSLDQQEILGLYNNVGLPPFLAPIEFAIELYKITYYTPAATGDTMTLASGMVMVPLNDSLCFPLVNYNHGTYFYGDEISSFGPEWFLGVPFATGGYVSILPDYLGYGETPIESPHSFMHAKTEASSTIDMIRASRSLCNLLGVGISDQLFLAGYSQGGHTTLAAQRSMERDFAQEFQITAVAGGSGPYDLSRTSRDQLLANKPSNSFFLGFVMSSYQFIYGNLWQNPSEAFVSPYDSIIPLYYDRKNQLRPNPLFPDTAIEMLQPAYIQAVKSDSLHPANVALRDNDLINWTPQSELRMYYCEGDEIVPFQNSLVALSKFVANGATKVSAISVDPNLDHGSCSIPTLLNVKIWFDGLKQNCVIPTLLSDTSVLGNNVEIGTPTHLEEEQLLSQIKLFPNPASDYLKLELPLDLRVKGVGLIGPNGETIKVKETQRGAGQRTFDVRGFSAGVYWMEIQLANRRVYLPFIKNQE